MGKTLVVQHVECVCVCVCEPRVFTMVTDRYLQSCISAERLNNTGGMSHKNIEPPTHTHMHTRTNHSHGTTRHQSVRSVLGQWSADRDVGRSTADIKGPISNSRERIHKKLSSKSTHTHRDTGTVSITLPMLAEFVL